MIGEIAAGFDQAIDQEEFLCARSMIDAFYVHIRLLAEFLVRGTNKLDFGPRDFGVKWSTPTTAAAERLCEHWRVASTYVVHFGGARVPQSPGGLDAFQISGRRFSAMSADALAVFEDFLQAFDAQRPPWEDGARIPNADKEPEAWAARVLADASRLLRDALATSRSRTGCGD
jgi:hypothetical protein